MERFSNVDESEKWASIIQTKNALNLINGLWDTVPAPDRGYKICFMLNSTEHEMSTANKN